MENHTACTCMCREENHSRRFCTLSLLYYSKLVDRGDLKWGVKIFYDTPIWPPAQLRK